VKFLKFLKWYFKTFASFLFLIFLVSALPVTAISALSHLSEKHINLQYPGEYVYVTFYQRPLKTPIVSVENSNFSVSYSNVQSYLGERYTYFEKPAFFLGDAEKALAKTGYNGTIYVPVMVGPLGVLLQVNGSTSGPDCIILGNQSVKKGTYVYQPNIYDSAASFNFPLARIKIESVHHVVNVSQDLAPLAAFMKANGIKCIASGKFFESIITTANLSPDLSNLLVYGFLLASPDKINLTTLYQSLYSEFSPHGYYPKLYVLKPGFVNAVLYPPRRADYWKDLWGGFLVFLPSLPLIGFVMVRERREEEKLRKLLMTSGGNPLMIDLLTLFFVGVAVLLILLFVGNSYGTAMLVMLAVLFALRYYGRGIKVSAKAKKVAYSVAVVASTFAFVVSSLYWLSSGPYGLASRITSDIAYVLAFPFKTINDLMFNLVWGAIFLYLPWISGAVLTSLILLGFFSRSRKPTWRVTARITSLTLAVMVIFALFSGVVFSSPIAWLYGSTSAGNLGATIVVSMNSPPFTLNSTEQRVELAEFMESYNALIEAVKQNGGEYGTIWSVGEAVHSEGMTEVALGSVSAYGPSLIHYLESARRRCRDAHWLYTLLKEKHGEAITYPYFLKKVQHNGSVMKFTVASAYASSQTTIGVRYMIVHTDIPIGGDVLLPLDVARNHNLTALPDTVLVYGGENVLKAIEAVHRKYPREFTYISVESGVKHIFSTFLKRSVALPFGVSAVLIPSIGLVLGVRDGGELRRRRRLFEALSISRWELLLPLVAFLPLAFVAIPMLRDAYDFYSLGFVHSFGGFAFLATPLLGLILAPLLYVASVWRCLK